MMDFNEIVKEMGNRKTGWVAGTGIDIYTKRSGERKRVFCVKWYERNRKFPTKQAWEREAAIRRNGNGYYTPGDEWVEKRREFPFTENGLEEAIKFTESAEFYKATEEWANRDC